MKLQNLLEEPIKNRRIFLSLLLIVTFLIGFLVLFRVPSDPDLGWHLETGRRIVQNHELPGPDWYSHTMPDFPWVDHEYASNVAMYGMYVVAGKVGVVIVYTLITLITFLLLLGETTAKKVSLPHRLVYGALVAPLLYSFVGARPQVITWFFLVLVFIAVARLKRNEKSKFFYWLPLLFLLWANLHGSVAIGVVVLGVFIAVEGAKARYFLTGRENVYLKKDHALTLRAWKRLTVVSVVAAVATLINPYFHGIYVELIRTVTDNFASGVIVEWLSPDFKQFTGLLLILLLLVVIHVIYIQRKDKIDFTYLVLLYVFLFMALQSVRHIPLLVIAVSPFLLEATKNGFEKVLLPVLRSRFVFACVSLVVVLTLIQFGSFVERWSLSHDEVSIAAYANQPFGAVAYLRLHPTEGNMFNDYDWGGYLIEQLPDTKVFVDGRMPHWRGQYGPDGELHLLRDYTSIVEVEPDWEARLEQFDVSHALVRSNSALATVMSESANWELVFRDSTASIFIQLSLEE